MCNEVYLFGCGLEFVIFFVVIIFFIIFFFTDLYSCICVFKDSNINLIFINVFFIDISILLFGSVLGWPWGCNQGVIDIRPICIHVLAMFCELRKSYNDIN